MRGLNRCHNDPPYVLLQSIMPLEKTLPGLAQVSHKEGAFGTDGQNWWRPMHGPHCSGVGFVAHAHNAIDGEGGSLGGRLAGCRVAHSIDM